jgi:hypothetical protein
MLDRGPETNKKSPTCLSAGRTLISTACPRLLLGKHKLISQHLEGGCARTLA